MATATKMTDGTGTTSYTYDQLDRMTETKNGHGNKIGYEYDLGNEQTKITYPNGKAVTRSLRQRRAAAESHRLGRTRHHVHIRLGLQSRATSSSPGPSEDTYTYNEADQITKSR